MTDINNQIKNRLIERYGMKQSEDGGHLQKGLCPQCNKKSLWTWTENPGNVQCNKKAKCGYNATSKELFPELFENLEKRFPVTKENPNATADGYVKTVRGFDLGRLTSFYTQAVYRNPNADKVVSTVKFWLDDAKTIAWEKFIDKVVVTDEDGDKTERDSRFIGSFRGLCWVPPTQAEPKQGQKVYITEGIFDAIALMLSGKFVISSMTAGQYPSKYIEAHRGKGIEWIFALDNDAAGRRDSVKHINTTKKKYNEISYACMPAETSTSKKDWNDLHRENALTKADFVQYDYYGGLLTARDALDKALLIYHQTEKKLFTFDFKNKLYGFSLNLEKYEKRLNQLREEHENKTDASSIPTDTELKEMKHKAMQESKVLVTIANCVPKFLYTQLNPITDELFYMFRVGFPDGRSIKSTMTGGQLSSVGDFRKRILSMAAGGVFKGSKEHHEFMLDIWMKTVNEVETVAYAGYVPEHDTYVYQNFACSKQGKIVQKNSEDFCQLPKLNIKSAYHNVEITVNHNAGDYDPSWLNNIHTAWGSKGITALAFWVGSLFVNQIRAKDKTFPFLELVGDPGTGKSTLIEFLWKLVGRFDYEGLDPSSSNNAAIARSMNQVSGLPVVFMEGDRQERAKAKQGGFNWSETKKLYNGRSMKSRGMRTQGNETYEPPFRGSLVITQNATVDAEQAVLERICHVWLQKSECNSTTLAASRALGNMPIEKCSGFMIKCLENREAILEMYFKRQKQYEKRLLAADSCKTPRIALNHSQIMGMVDALTIVTGITTDQRVEAVTHLAEMAAAREAAIKREHPDVEWFFEVVETLLNRNCAINHKKTNDNCVALKMAEVYSHAANHNLRLPEINDMKKLLSGSRKFVKYGPVRSVISSKTAKCWIFDVPMLKPLEEVA